MTVGHRKVEGWTVPQGAIDLIENVKWNSCPTVLPPIISLDLNLLPRPIVVHWVAKNTIITPKKQRSEVIDISVLEDGLTVAHQADVQVREKVETSATVYTFKY